MQQGGKIKMANALERTVHFLSDWGPQAERIQLGAQKRTELYEEYCEGVSQLKNVLRAKSSLQSWALPSLERSDA